MAIAFKMSYPREVGELNITPLLFPAGERVEFWVAFPHLGGYQIYDKISIPVILGKYLGTLY